MGQYAGAVVTTAGLNLITSAIAAQETVTFTAVEASSEALAPGTNLESLVSLNDVEQTVTPSNVGVYNGNIVQLIANFENSTVAADYSMETLGVWAQQGAQTPILFAVIQAVTPDVMPEASVIAPTSIIFRIQMTVTNADQVTVQVVAAGAATVADLAYYLPTANVYNALDQTASGYALDARQGAALDGRLGTVESYVTAHDTAIIASSILTYAEAFTASGLYPFVTSLTTTDLPGASTYYTQANGFVMYRKSTNPTISIVLFGRDDSIWLREKSGGDPWGSWVQMLDAGAAASTYVPKADIENNLTTATAGKVLDATQGKTLAESSLRMKGQLSSGSLNAVTTYGVHYFTSSNTDVPTGSTYGVLIVWRASDSSSVIEQMAIIPGTPPQVWFRDTVNGGTTWRTWNRLAYASELSSYLPTASVYNGLDQSSAGYALDARQGGNLVAKAGSTMTGILNIDNQTAGLRVRFPWAKGTSPASTVYRNVYWNSNSASADAIALINCFVQANGTTNFQFRANRNVAGNTSEPMGIDIVNPKTGAGELKANINGTQYDILHRGNAGTMLAITPDDPITTSTTNKTITGISNFYVFIGQIVDSGGNGIMIGYRFSATQIVFLGMSGANNSLHMSRLSLTMSGDKITSVAGLLTGTATGLIRIYGIM